MTEENDSGMSVEEVCQALKEVNARKLSDIDKWRLEYLKKVEVERKFNVCLEYEDSLRSVD